MKTLHLEPTSIAQWYAIVNDASRVVGYHLEGALENYLVITLDRFSTENQLASVVIAKEFLQGVENRGREGGRTLRRIGDECLLLAGLFPERAVRKHVSESYFVMIGQQAYQILADIHPIETDNRQLFHQLSIHFISLMQVLKVMRKIPYRMQSFH